MSIRLGSLYLDLTEHCFYIGKQEVHLTMVETKLLHILFANPERVVTYQQFMAFVWGQFTNKELASLRTHMYQLRQKIEIGEPALCQIVSVPQTGYRLHLNLFPKTPIQNHEQES
jgi:two-component system, OmpR family, KDP operon response regulator KdpE